MSSLDGKFGIVNSFLNKIKPTSEAETSLSYSVRRRDLISLALSGFLFSNQVLSFSQALTDKSSAVCPSLTTYLLTIPTYSWNLKKSYSGKSIDKSLFVTLYHGNT